MNFKFKNEPWEIEIKKSQEEIVSLEPHPHYIEAYRAQENQYWKNIPKWIYEDNINKNINRILDVGGAYGTLALFGKNIFDCEIYMTDFLDVYVSQSFLKKRNINFQVNNIELDSFPWDLDFDIIIFTEILEHLNFHPVPTLKKLHSLLSDDGHLYLSTPDATEWGRITKFYSSIADMPPPQKGQPIVDEHVFQYYKDELFKVLNDAGFKIEKFDYSPGVAARHFNLALVKK